MDVLDGARVPTVAALWNRYKTDGSLNIASILEGSAIPPVRAWIMVARTLCSSKLANFNQGKALAYLCWFCKIKAFLCFECTTAAQQSIPGFV